MRCGPSFIKKLNGIFAIALWDESCQTLHLFRDRLGVKPLFYTKKDETTIFSSEIKGLFAYPDIVPELDRNSLNEIFALGPAKTYGKGVFKNILEVLPGEHISISHTSFKRQFYWKLSSCLHADSPSDTIEKTRWLLTDSIKKQMLSDVPICTFLSGGIDSSLFLLISRKTKRILNPIHSSQVRIVRLPNRWQNYMKQTITSSNAAVRINWIICTKP